MNHILNLLLCDGNCLPDLVLNKINSQDLENQVQMNIREKPQQYREKDTALHSQAQTNYTRFTNLRGIQLKSPIKEQFHYENKSKSVKYNIFTPHHLSLLKNSRQNVIKKRIKPLKKMSSEASYYEQHFQVNKKQMASRSIQIKTFTPKHYPLKIDQNQELFQTNIEIGNTSNIKTKRPKKICQFTTAIKLKHNLEEAVKVNPLIKKQINNQKLKQTQNLPKTPKLLKLRTPHHRLIQTPQVIMNYPYQYSQTQYSQDIGQKMLDEKKTLKQILLQKQVLQSEFKNLREEQNFLKQEYKFMNENLYKKVQNVQKISLSLKQSSEYRQVQIKQIQQFIQITKERKRIQKILKNIQESGLSIDQFYSKDSLQLDTEVGGKDDSRLSID